MIKATDANFDTVIVRQLLACDIDVESTLELSRFVPRGSPVRAGMTPTMNIARRGGDVTVG
jgi:hypothetical protein